MLHDLQIYPSIIYSGGLLINNMDMAEIPANIFKSYDIRGLADSELSEDLAYRLGRAFVHFLRTENIDFSGKKLVVGYDMRETSGPFSAQVIKGITDEGVAVVNIGLATTPSFNFGSAHFDEHVGGIMVTASHNPAEYNGFKMTRGNGMPIGKGSGMEELRDLVMANDFGDSSEKKGEVTERDVFPEYLERIESYVSSSDIKELKIVIDGGNGMGEVTFKRVLETLPQVSVEWMFMEPNGTFPNHEANPLKTSTLKDLQEKVKEVGADFGFALDGDADRIGLVDEHGDVVDASFVGALVGLEVLKQHPGSHMMYDLRSSRVMKEVWEENGATTEMTMVGHANIKKMLADAKGSFASELSLHLYYGDMYNVESTDLSLLYFLKFVSESGKSISEHVEPLKKYFHSGEINFEVEDKDGAIARLKEKFEGSSTGYSDLDGLWLEFEWGWFSVRKSNTEPVLRLNLEVWKKDDMEAKLAEVKEIIES
jgi:phosphomannomutase